MIRYKWGKKLGFFGWQATEKFDTIERILAFYFYHDVWLVSTWNSCMTLGAYGGQAMIKPNIKGVTSDCENWALLLNSID